MALNARLWELNPPFLLQRMEPRAGFDPATNSLRGCRSTGLSHRGTYCEMKETTILKLFRILQIE